MKVRWLAPLGFSALMIVLALLALGRGSSQPAEASPLGGGLHWPRTTAPLRLGFAVNGVDEQLVANVLDAWNHVPVFELGTVGQGDPAMCDWQAYIATPGRVEVCSVASGLPLVGQADWTYDSNNHIIGARVFVGPTYSFTLLCHEIGHALGLGHPDAPNGCMEAGGVDTCPAQADIDELTAIYQHDDGFTIADPGPFTRTGHAPCSPEPAPTPTPVPFCDAHPNHRKCRP